MNINSTEINMSEVDRLVRSFKALDTSFITKTVFARNLLVRILLVTYLAKILLFNNIYIESIILILEQSFILLQGYLTFKLIHDGGFNSIDDWKFLYNQQSFIGKLFVFVTIIIIFTMAAFQLTMQLDPMLIITSLVLIALTLYYITNLVFEPILKRKVQEYLTAQPDQEIQTEQERERFKESQYYTLAVNTLTSDEQKTEHTTVRDASTEKLRKTAIRKLENLNDDQSGDNHIALTPEEIDMLTPEEIDALIPDMTPAERESKKFRYAWEKPPRNRGV